MVRSGGDRLRQTSLIPRSPDGDNKWRTDWQKVIIFFMLWCMGWPYSLVRPAPVCHTIAKMFQRPGPFTGNPLKIGEVASEGDRLPSLSYPAGCDYD